MKQVQRLKNAGIQKAFVLLYAPRIIPPSKHIGLINNLHDRATQSKQIITNLAQKAVRSLSQHNGFS